MHSRSPYRDALDFEALARVYPPLSKFIHGHHFNFQDDSGQRCLTQALLKRDFDLQVDLPADRLCPPVPNRLNYVLWIQDIVLQMQQNIPLALHRRNVTVRGLDIGTGASAIYPLLACALEPNWSFVATELDAQSYTYASKNVDSNGLSNRIRVVKVSANNSPIDSVNFGFNQLLCIPENEALEDARTSTGTDAQHAKKAEIQFTMCNPPFYSSATELEQSEALKEHSPFGACTGAAVEMITPGGEARFVEAMVRESVHTSLEGHSTSFGQEKTNKRQRVDSSRSQDWGLSGVAHGPVLGEGGKTRTLQWVGPRWYTSMLGKMGSVAEVVNVLKALGISNYAITEFVQGHTRRWAVGWSLDAWRLSDDIARILNPNPILQRLLPPRNVLRLPITVLDADTHEKLLVLLREIGVTVLNRDITPGAKAHQSEPTIFVSASCDTWSRSARRKRKRGEESGVTTSTLAADPVLVCAIILPANEDRGKEAEVQWIYGWDRGFLESFTSHIAKRMHL